MAETLLQQQPTFLGKYFFQIPEMDIFYNVHTITVHFN